MEKNRGFASLSAGLLARKGEATPAMDSFHTAPVSRRSPPGEDDGEGLLSGVAAALPFTRGRNFAKPMSVENLRRRLNSALGASEAEDAAVSGPGAEAPPDAVVTEPGGGQTAVQEAQNPPPGRSAEPAPLSKTPGPEDRAAAVGSGAFVADVADDGDCEIHDMPCIFEESLHDEAYSKNRASVTLRLETPEFLRLKLASAQLERTSQDILTSAMEAYLDELSIESVKNCQCLRRAAKAEARARQAAADAKKK